MQAEFVTHADLIVKQSNYYFLLVFYMRKAITIFILLPFLFFAPSRKPCQTLVLVLGREWFLLI